MSDKSPTWDFKTPYKTALWIYENSVDKIEKVREYRDDDVRETLTFYCKQGVPGKKSNQRRGIPTWVLGTNNESEVRFRPELRGLVQLDNRLKERLEEIEEWNRTNEEERATYQKLKAKFENTPV